MRRQLMKRTQQGVIICKLTTMLNTPPKNIRNCILKQDLAKVKELL